jgi:hypothetical protein
MSLVGLSRPLGPLRRASWPRMTTEREGVLPYSFRG